MEPFREDSLFWHGVWQSAGRPNKGALYTIMTRTRNLYHYTVRKVMKQADHVRAAHLLEAAQKGDVEETQLQRVNRHTS